MTKYPDRSNVVYTKEQIEFRKIFAEAAKFASEIVSDPVKKSTYPRQGRKSIYHCALSDFMKEYKRKKADGSSADADIIFKQPQQLLPHKAGHEKRERVKE